MLDQLRADVKTSLLAGDRFRTETLKMAQSALLYARVAKGASSVLDENECIVVMQKEIKKRKEASEMYRTAGAVEKADLEDKEVGILQAYVPKMIAGKELLDLIETWLIGKDVGTISFSDAMKECAATMANADKGQLAGILKQKLSK